MADGCHPTAGPSAACGTTACDHHPNRDPALILKIGPIPQVALHGHVGWPSDQWYPIRCIDGGAGGTPQSLPEKTLEWPPGQGGRDQSTAGIVLRAHRHHQPRDQVGK